MPTPANPEQYIGAEKEGQADHCRKQMEGIQIADDKMNADCAAESSASHHSDDLNKTPIEVGAARHEQQQAADGAQSTAESGTIVRDYRDQRRRDSRERADVEPDESQVGRNEDGRHSKDGDGDSGQN